VQSRRVTYISDTHALVWLLEDSEELSPQVADIFATREVRIVILTIVLAEIRFLYARGRIGTNLDEVVDRIVNAPNMEIYPLNELVVSLMPTQLRIHDAIIVATGLVFRDIMNEPTAILTKDAKIVSCGLIDTVW